MSVSFAIAIYVVIWWTVLFAILPIGVRTQGEDGAVVPGTPESAPTRPRLLRVVLLTTLVSALVFAGLWAAVALRRHRPGALLGARSATRSQRWRAKRKEQGRWALLENCSTCFPTRCSRSLLRRVERNSFPRLGLRRPLHNERSCDPFYGAHTSQAAAFCHPLEPKKMLPARLFFPQRSRHDQRCCATQAPHAAAVAIASPAGTGY